MPTVALILAFFLAACSSDSGTESRSSALGDASATGGTASSTGGASGHATGGAVSQGTGGASRGGASSGGRQSGSGGGESCPPECFVANQCVTACGQIPVTSGCCPCPSGTVNVFSCGAADSGAGSGGVSCDTRRVRCPALPPTCPAGQVVSVPGSCYGPCVPIDSCVCAAAADCPDANQYTCHMSATRCGPYVL
jgi:hypothetical protein